MFIDDFSEYTGTRFQNMFEYMQGILSLFPTPRTVYFLDQIFILQDKESALFKESSQNDIKFKQTANELKGKISPEALNEFQEDYVMSQRTLSDNLRKEIVNFIKEYDDYIDSLDFSILDTPYDS
jgi:t-SNARE complex subunit (syntaxin)